MKLIYIFLFTDSEDRYNKHDHANAIYKTLLILTTSLLTFNDFVYQDIAFVGVAAGKTSRCMKKEIPVCLLLLEFRQPNLAKEANPCAKQQALVDCLNSATKRCKEKATETINNLVSHAQDVCNANSETYKNALKHSSCLQQDVYRYKYVRNCLAEHLEDFRELGEINPNSIQEYSDKLMKFICPRREKLANCGYDHTKSECGEEAEIFSRKMGGPSDQLMKETCDSASILSTNIALIFLRFLIAVFLNRNIF